MEVILGFAVVAAVFFLFFLAVAKGRFGRAVRAPEEVRDLIVRFLQGEADAREWQEFVSLPILDSELEAIRQRCLFIEEEFPPAEPGQFCGPEGLGVLRALADHLEARVSQAQT